MSRRALPRLLAVLTLTLALAGPAHAAPTGRHVGHGSLWSRAVAWLTSLITPTSLTIDQGGMMDPNGNH
jgi:hypothetical protein